MEWNITLPDGGAERNTAVLRAHQHKHSVRAHNTTFSQHCESPEHRRRHSQTPFCAPLRTRAHATRSLDGTIANSR